MLMRTNADIPHFLDCKMQFFPRKYLHLDGLKVHQHDKATWVFSVCWRDNGGFHMTCLGGRDKASLLLILVFFCSVCFLSSMW